MIRGHRSRPGVRLEQAAEAMRLRAEGLTQEKIAADMGISRTYASALLSDPDGSKDKARKATYGGVCEECGAHTDGSNGRAKAPSICGRCAAQRTHDERRWTRESILEAFRRYFAENADQPSASEVLVVRPGYWFPTVGSVQREFGSWAAAIRAAGWVPFAKNPPKEGVMPTDMSRYVILKENGDGAFHAVGEQEAQTRERALRDWIMRTEQPGTYATVPVSQWNPRRYRVEMRPTLLTDTDDA